MLKFFLDIDAFGLYVLITLTSVGLMGVKCWRIDIPAINMYLFYG